MGIDFENARMDPTATADRASVDVEARTVEGDAAARESTDRAAVMEDREAIVTERERIEEKRGGSEDGVKRVRWVVSSNSFWSRGDGAGHGP